MKQQFADLRRLYPQASLQELPGGAHLLDVSGIRLPAWWAPGKARIVTVFSAGFPFSGPPRYFWCPLDVAMCDGREPNATRFEPIPVLDVPGRRFIWAASAWNPNRDSLTTYVDMVAQRFRYLGEVWDDEADDYVPTVPQ